MHRHEEIQQHQNNAAVVHPLRHLFRASLLLSLLVSSAKGFTMTRYAVLYGTFRGANLRPRSRQIALTRAVSPSLEPVDADEIHSTYVATCTPGLSFVLQEELESFPGVMGVETSGTAAVRFSVRSPRDILWVLLWTRTAHKIMELLVDARRLLYTRDDLYELVQTCIPVEDLLRGDVDTREWLTLSVDTIVHNARDLPRDLNHSHFCALQVKNALVDAARDSRSGNRPTVDTEDPDVPLTLVLRGQPEGGGATAALYRNIHGRSSLHKRGYRGTNHDHPMHKASLKESTAAALLLAAGWNNGDTSHPRFLVDPMMGSGTFVLEAALLKANYAPGLIRRQLRPSIVRWDPTNYFPIWKELLLEAATQAKQNLENLHEPCCIGNDWRTTALAEQSFRAIPELSTLLFSSGHSNCQDWSGPPNNDEPWLIVCNPPWGVRLDEDAAASWEALGVFLRHKCPKGSVAWILSGNKAMTRHLRLRKSQSIPLQVGDQQLRWLKYEIGRKNEDVRKTTVVSVGEETNEWL